MSDFEKWLMKLETDIKRGIEDARSYGCYVDEIICNSERFYIWKKSGQDETKKEDNATIIILAPLKPELVEPVPIRLRLQNNWRNSFENNTFIVLSRVFTTVVSKEEKVITLTLTKNAKLFEVDNEVASRDDLQEAINYINSQGNYPDTLLVSPLQMPKLMHEKGFISNWNLPAQFAESKGKHFIGLMGELSVYATVSLTEKEEILYEKRQVKVRKTPLIVEFENYVDPKILLISEDLIAWSVEEGAVAKIILKRG